MGVPGSVNGLLGAAAGGYQVSRSLRFNSADSAYLSRTPGSAGNRTTWTLSMWVKRSKITSGGSGGLMSLFGWQSGGSGQSGLIGYSSSTDTLSFGQVASTYRTTNAVFRDVSAWAHLVFVWDSNNATDAQRCRIYVNGSEASYSTSLSIASGTQLDVNSTIAHGLGADIVNVSGAARDFFDGYLADIWFLDGIAAIPSDFAETNATTGQWVPKKYTGSTSGTNTFHLELADKSSNTATTLGKDTANSNNFTPNNFSVTAGAGNDSLVDTPTSVSATDTGIGGEIRGNYCTLNPLKKGSSLTFANGNLDQSGSGQYQHSTSTFVLATGKWYFEITHLVGEGNSIIGLVNAASLGANEEASNYLGQTANGYGFYANGQLINSGSFSGTWGTDWSATGSVIGCAFDADTGKIWFAYNGTWQASGNPATGANPAFTASNHNGLCPAGRTYSSGQLAFNFGQRAFAYTAPSGFKALCDTNLTEGSITTSGTFTGNASSDGPFVWLNGVPTAMTINSNAVTFGTHADKLGNGFKVRSSSGSYNTAGSNTYSITTTGAKFKYARAQANP